MSEPSIESRPTGIGVNEAAGFRLSPQQRRLLWLAERTSGSPYRVHCTLVLEGGVDPEELRSAVDRVVERYEILRTVFRISPLLAQQVIREDLGAGWSHRDVRSLSGEAREKEIREALAGLAAFDLEQGPLVRVSLFTLDESRSLLAVSVAAACADRATLVRFVGEVAREYVHPGGQPCGEVLQYADIAEWLNQLLEASEPWAQDIAWPARNAAELEELHLPFERSTVELRSSGVPVRLTPETHADLEALAVACGVSPSVVLQTGWHALLGRLTGAGELVTGWLSEGRKNEEIRDALGPLAKYLPVRVKFAPDLRFRELVAGVGAATERVLGIDESFSWEPLLGGQEGKGFFPFAYELWELPPALEVGSGVWTFESLSSWIEPFTAILVCRLSAASLETEILYNAAALEAGDAQLLAERFATLLAAAVAHSEEELGALPLLGPGERRWLADWNDTRTVAADLRPVHEWFSAQARLSPGSTAVAAGGRSLTYEELDRRSHQLAHFLRRSGIGPDVLVGIALERSPEMIVGLLGTLKAGGAYLPLDLSHPRERLSLILAEARPACILTTASSGDRLPVPDGMAVHLDRDWPRIAEESDQPVGVSVDLEHLAYVIYTSGSTGRPKGVMISHGGMLNYLRWAVETYGAAEGSGAPVHSPLGFDLTVTSLWAPLVSGAAAVMVAEESVDSLLEVLREEEDFSLLKLTPAHLSLIEQGIGASLAGRARTLVLGGEALFAESLARWRREAPATRIVNEYGPTETVVGCCVYEMPPQGVTAGPVPIGRPIANTRLYVVDRWGNPVPLGVSGEIWISGAGVARGYLARPDLTAERFVPDPFAPEPGARAYRSGDLGSYGRCGDLEYLGRIDHQVKIHGYRIELQEIEAVLLRSPEIREAAVVVAGTGDNRQLVAFVVPAEQGVELTGLRDLLAAHLPEYMVPARMIELAALPLTENGKIDRGALLSRETEPASRRHPYVAPRTPVEELLCAIWSELLGVERVGTADDFFDLGGHSLLSMRLVSRIRSAFGAKLPLGAVFTDRTVAELARVVEAERWKDLGLEPGPILPVEEGRPKPLSFQQRRLWILHQVNPGEAVYHIPSALRLRGPLHREALDEALNGLVCRHESLRTTFDTFGGELVQIVAPPAPVDYPWIDLRSYPADKREAEAHRRVQEEVDRPFDLKAGPLLRVLLLQLDDQDHVVALVMHHIVSDGWSMDILVRELVTLYEARRTGTEPKLADLPVQYGDYAAWQHLWLTGEILDRHLEFWRGQLAEPLSYLELPTDRPRPEVPSLRGGSVYVSLESGTYAVLQALGRRQLATPFMVLLAAWNTLLHRYSGQEDILVGTPIAGRGRAEVEGLIGFFVNTLVLRNDLAGEPTFPEFLERVRVRSLDAYGHDELPFDRLVEELQPERRSQQTPFFQVAYTLINRPQAGVSLPGLELQSFGIEVSIAKFDLTFSGIEQAHELLLEIEYSSDLYDAVSAQRMLGHLQSLLGGIAEDPERPIQSLPLLTASELEQATAGWNRTATGYPREACIHELFEAHARRAPGQTAAVHEGRTLTYGELDQQSGVLARHLNALGVGPEVLVGLLMDRSLKMVVAMVGILKAGGAYLPLDPSHPRDRLALMLEDAGAGIVLTHQPRTADVPAGSWRVLRVEDLVHGGDSGDGDPALRSAVPENLAYVIYTSGSTGMPKGVAVPHRAIVRLVRDTSYVSLTEYDCIAQASNASFDAATFEIWGALANGGSFVIIDKETALSPAGLAAVLRREWVSTMFLTTALFQQVVREEPGAFSTLRQVLFGGEAVDPRWARELLAGSPPERLLHVYGPTESTTFASWHPILEVPAEARTIPIGLPLSNTTIYVVDRGFAPVPAGVPGELLIGADGLARGYLCRPALTAEKFIPDPFGPPGSRLYRTGDLVRRDAAGAIEFLSRIDHQVKLRGFRVELGEIEAALLRHPGVESAVVIVREDAPGDKTLIAYVVPKSGSLDVRDLKPFLKQSLPDYMVPSALVTLEALPLTPNGKIDRAALPEPDLREGLGEGYVAPRTPLEEVMAMIWGQVLGVETLGVHDDFFDLGGNSLLATRLIARLRETFHVEIPVRRMFEAPTIAGIAQDLENDLRAGMGQAVPDLVPVPRDGELPLSFSQQRLWFLDQLLPEGNVYNISTTIWLQGALEVGTLRRSLNEIVRRHEVLRSRFLSEEGRPVLVLEPEMDLELPRVDLQGIPAPARYDEVQRLAQREARRSFSLSQAPLLRVLYVKTGEGEQVLLATVHHIVFDGWSAGILFRELDLLYRAFAGGLPSPLPELPVQYVDYAAWQRRWLSGEVLEQQLAYWRQQLADAPDVLELPLDRPRPSVQTFRGTNRSASLPGEASRRLQELSREEGVTPFMAMLAAFYTLLFHYSGQERIAIGTPIANRTRSETEGLIGFFANTLVLCSRVDARRSFRDLLLEVRDVSIGGYAHQDVPFEKLVDELQPHRDLAHQPLFQVMFLFEGRSPAGGNVVAPEIGAGMTDTSQGAAKFDMTLFLEDDGTSLHTMLEYNIDLFDGTTASRLLQHFGALLQELAEDPDRNLAELSLLWPAERHQLLTAWNDTERAFADDRGLHELFEAQTDLRPEATAAVFGTRSMTYGELEARSNQVAHHLRSQGVRPGVLVAIYMERSLEMIPALLGILKAGGAYAPLDTNYPAARIEWILSNFEIGCMISQAPLLHTVADLRVPALRNVLCLDAEAAGVPSLKTADFQVTTGLSGLPVTRVEGGAGADDTAYIIFTSGSTGTPKGVVVLHRPVLNLIDWVNREHRVGPGDRLLFITSLCFDLSVYDVFGILAAGGSLHIAAAEEVGEPQRLLDLLLHAEITFWDSAPAALQQLVPFLDLLGEGEGGECLRLLFLSGDWIPVTLPDHIRRVFPASQTIALGGATEATVWSNFFPVGTVDPQWVSIPYGRPIQNAHYYVLGPGLRPCPIGVPGDLFIADDCLCLVYAAAPALTADRFLPDPFTSKPGGRMYRTGDRARFRPDGNLQFLGRADHQVKLRGFRIELGEIESTLRSHPGVGEAIVIVREDQPGDRRLVAYLLPDKGESADTDELRGFVKDRLPEYMVPSAFVYLETFPVTSNGKVDRRSLPVPERSVVRDDKALLPRDTIELQLVQFWEELLNTKPVRIDDDFFDLGGNSLIAVQLIAQIRQVFHRDLPLATLFQASTILRLAHVLRQDLDEEPLSPLVAIQPHGSLPPLFCVHAIGGEVLSYYELAQSVGVDQPIYGLQAPAPAEIGDEHISLEETAARYIDAIREVSPRGPYRLAGYSYGGVVAFEMAQQLRRQGEEVVFLAMLDAFSPLVARRGRSRNDVVMLAGFARELARRSGQSLDLTNKSVEALHPDDAIRYILDLLLASNLLPPDTDLDWVHRFLHGIKAREGSLADYQPKVYDGEVTVFSSTEADPESSMVFTSLGIDIHDPVRGWDKLTSRPVRVFRLPGFHETILQSPRVELLANYIRTCLMACASVRTED